MNPLKFINGYKTYLSLGAYAAYLVALQHGLPPIPDLEALLKAAIGASFAHKVAKVAEALKSEPPAGPQD